MAAPLRTFIALEISESVRSSAVRLINRLAASGAKVTWTAPQNLHVTLKFLGDVDVTAVAAVCKAVQQAAANVSPFRVAVAGAGAYPDVNRPRVLWLGVSQGREQLIDLHGRVEDTLGELTYPPDGRRFSPHITLGRVRGPAGELSALLEKDATFDAGDMLVEEVVIYSSELTSDGPAYTPMGRASLDGA